MEENKKVCNKECTHKHSEEWSLSTELAKSNRRMFTALVIVIALWFATIAGFVWYINQYDYETYNVEQGGNWGNTFIDGGNQGDINCGAESVRSEASQEEAQR